MSTRTATAQTWYLRNLAAVVLTVAVLYFSKPFLTPLALAILLTFILAPVVTFLQRSGLPRIPAVLLTTCLAVVLIGLALWGIGAQLRSLARELPTHRKEIDAKIAALRGNGKGPFSDLLQMAREIASGKGDTDDTQPAAPPQERVIVTRETSSMETIANVVGPVAEPLAETGLVLILLVFMLINREDLRDRLIGLLGHGHLTGTTRVLIDAAQRLSRYLFTQLMINLSFGALLGLGLYFIGVPFFYLWGSLAALLRFIPYVGSWLAAAFPLVLSFAVSPSLLQPILVLALFLLLDLVTGNVVEPILFGHGTGVSPVALLIAAAFWTWIWGTVGLVLSTPLTVCLVVLGQHVPRLRFLKLLLGDEPALAAHVGFYQRLLARDQAEAKQSAASFAATVEGDNVYDTMILPALAIAQRDRRSGALSAGDEQFVIQTTREVLDDLNNHLPPTPSEIPEAGQTNGSIKSSAVVAETAPDERVLVLGCPARKEAEELTLLMLATLLHSKCRVEIAPAIASPAELDERVEQTKPAILVIAVLPPGGLVQAAYLCKRLRKQYPKLPLVVGYWGGERNYERILVRLRSAGASYVTTSLRQTASQVQALAAITAPALPTKVPQPTVA